MVNKLQIISIASTFTETCYEKLRKISIANEENDPEYDMIVDKLKRCVEGENSLYQELSDEDINNGLTYFKNYGIHSNVDNRINNKLNHIYRERNNQKTSVELGMIIASKIMIDVLKNITGKLLTLDNDNVTKEDNETLLLYHDAFKYQWLTANNFIEKLAINARFCILAMPEINLKDLEKAYHTSFVKESVNLSYKYILSSIQELFNIHSDDKYLNVYLTLFEVARIETMLPYLDKDTLIKLSDYLNNLNTKEDNYALRRIKKLIKKRKEELK